MTKREFEGFVRTWKRRIGVDDWKIDIRYVASNDENCASISMHNDYRNAILFIHDGWQKEDAVEVQRIIVHELVHILLHGLRIAQQSILHRGLMTSDVETIFNDRFTHELERATEDITERFLRAYLLD